jgi:hypothetical protein
MTSACLFESRSASGSVPHVGATATVRYLLTTSDRNCFDLKNVLREERFGG